MSLFNIIEQKGLKNNVKEEICKTYFGEFEISSIKELPLIYPLDTSIFKDTQADQIKILNKLEKNLPFFDGTSFEDQVHFRLAYQTPIQRWFSYREGYSTRLVNAFIKELKISGNVFDPFSGSGTTLLASRLIGLNSFGIDINPVSVLISRVENEQYELKDIILFEKEIKNLKNLEKSEYNFQTTFELAEKVFNKEILQSLLQIKDYINSIRQEKIKSIYFAAWLSIIENVSNVKKEGNGIKYKNRKRTPTGYINIEKEKWEQENFPYNKFDFVKTKLVDLLEIVLTDLKYNYGKCNRKPKIYEGNCLELEKYFQDKIELTFFSPPYCNCFDYFEIHKIELWLGNFISNKEEFRKLRNTGFRSNINSLNNKPIVYRNYNLENLIYLFEKEKLWNNKIPSVVRGYFDDMKLLLSKLYKQTENNGYVGIVVGNSAYSNVIIPTDILIVDIAKELNFKIKNIFVTRHLTTSSQQKRKLECLKKYLRESIVLLQK